MTQKKQSRRKNQKAAELRRLLLSNAQTLLSLGPGLMSAGSATGTREPNREQNSRNLSCTKLFYAQLCIAFKLRTTAS
jgi:hypothetical protein